MLRYIYIAWHVLASFLLCSFVFPPVDNSSNYKSLTAPALGLFIAYLPFASDNLAFRAHSHVLTASLCLLVEPK